MKAKSIYLSALLAVSVAATALGNDEPRKTGLVVMPVKGTETFKVIYKAENAGKVKLNIYNAKSEIIFSESMSDTEGFILPLNFSTVDFGEYTLELVDATGKRVEHISHQPAKVLDNVRVSKISTGTDKFLLSVVNPVTEKVTVKIFDTYNNLIHTEVKNVSGDFAQVYNIKNFSGSCTFEVSDNAGNVKTIQF